MSLGEWSQVGNEAAFAAVGAACFYGGAIYTSGDGQIWKVDVESGDWERVHEADDWDTRFLVPFAGALCLVEQDGTPYTIDLGNATAEPGDEAEYADITHAVPCGSRLYGMTGNMVTYLDDEGDWQPTDGVDRGDVRALVEHDETGFWLLSTSGLSFIGADGTTQDAGDSESWGGTVALTQYDGKLYYVWEDGNVYGYDVSNGEEITVIGSGDFSARFMFAFDGSLLIVSDAGTLFRVSLG